MDSEDEGGDAEFDAVSADGDDISEAGLFEDDDKTNDAASERDEETSEDDEDEEEDDNEDDEEVSPVAQKDAGSSSAAVPTATQSIPHSSLQRPLSPQDHVVQEALSRSTAAPIQVEEAKSPAAQRRSLLIPTVKTPRSYTVEAICAIAHTEPTHALAASSCMTHLLTGSQDGYIRDYDVFTAVNGKTFLTAPQRVHCAVVEGTMKAGQLRTWWENPATANPDDIIEDSSRSAVTSMIMHSDALWALAGSERGHVNLFTVRHDPGRLITVLTGHRAPVSSLSMNLDQKGFFSAGWDGVVLEWDLNTGQQVRDFKSHSAQVAVVAVRPYSPILPLPAPSSQVNEMKSTNGSKRGSQAIKDEDADSEGSYDPLFDEEPEEGDESQSRNQAVNPTRMGDTQSSVRSSNLASQRQTALANPRGPPILDAEAYGRFSSDVLMTASVDGAIVLWDRRMNDKGRGVGRLEMNSKTPPWCVSACWSADGRQVYAGRRNSTVDVWDTRQFGQTYNGVPKLLKTLRNPISSGAVSCVAAFPDGRHIAVASNDNIRLWNASEAAESETSGRSRSGVPFKIIPGHHGGIISQMLIDPGARFMVSASSNRGWSGESTRTVLIHDIKTIV